MSSQDTNIRSGGKSGKYPLLLTVLSGLSFVLLLLLFVGNSFQPPSAGQGKENGAYGIEIVEGQTVYVPAYSNVYSDAGLPILLAVSLNLRSTDPKASVTLTRVDYYDTAGKLLRRYVTSPQRLGPLETKSFIIEKTDYEGGSGANFIVQWRADGPVNPPLIEAVMVGIDPEYSFSFVRSGTSVTGFED